MNCWFCHQTLSLLEEKQSNVKVYRCFNHKVPTGFYLHNQILQTVLVSKYNGSFYAVKINDYASRIEKWDNFQVLDNGYWHIEVEDEEIVRLKEIPNFSPENVEEKLAIILTFS